MRNIVIGLVAAAAIIMVGSTLSASAHHYGGYGERGEYGRHGGEYGERGEHRRHGGEYGERERRRHGGEYGEREHRRYRY